MSSNGVLNVGTITFLFKQWYNVGEPSWKWSYGSWIYNYLCNQCLSPQTLRVRTSLRRDVLDTILWDKVCQWLAAGRWFSLGTLVCSTNKTDCHDIAEILWNIMWNFCNQCLFPLKMSIRFSPWRSVVDTTLCKHFYRWLEAARLISPNTR